jgi:hypothetical protein
VSGDPFDSPEWRTYAQQVRDEMVPMMRDSAFVMSLIPDGPPDVKFAVELGFAIMLDKPFIAVVRPGMQVSAKLIAIADRIIEDDGDPAALADKLQAVMREMDAS